MTFQDMLKKDPQGNITGLRTIDTTGNFHLLGQPARRWEYTYTLADPITGYTPKKSITLETIVSGRHIFISMTAPAANFRYNGTNLKLLQTKWRELKMCVSP